ncbi:hypothetical protein DL762_006249 [Monosporascus cannonballus]|uniref:Beta-lactamase-related domain-containing protein n=1 Tax=Monosporascus cannonballus TaxID=155416 RepID=A0ABY0H2L9_9PEZI|nr:hypothetical protein DL762_006249 [Monosporascus cannonballus]
MLCPSTALRAFCPRYYSAILSWGSKRSLPPSRARLASPYEPINARARPVRRGKREGRLPKHHLHAQRHQYIDRAQSIHEESPILELHYTPQYLNPNCTSIDGQPVYRLGSISITFVVPALLKIRKVKFDNPVTKYVPGVRSLRGETPERNHITAAHWDRVTIGALASHMSGVGADRNPTTRGPPRKHPANQPPVMADLASVPRSWTQLGLPELDESLLPNYAGVLGLPPCDRAEFFNDFGKRHSAYVPFTMPVFSNVASVILGYVVDAVSNTTASSPSARPSSGASLGYEDIAGGFYSNTADLLAFGWGILRCELRERGGDAQVGEAAVVDVVVAGSSWAGPGRSCARRRRRPTSASSSFTANTGNFNTYNNMLCLVPDYDLVLAILSGGAESNNCLVDGALSAVIREVLPAIEAAGKAQAGALVGGTYSDAASNSSVGLSLDAGSRTAWRAVFDVGTPEIAVYEKEMFWPSAEGATWGKVDRFVYQFRSLDDFVIKKNEGETPTLSLRGFVVALKREA